MNKLSIDVSTAQIRLHGMNRTLLFADYKSNYRRLLMLTYSEAATFVLLSYSPFSPCFKYFYLHKKM